MPYVYRHIRLDKNEPFYIGIGSKENFYRAYEKRKRNKIWNDIASKTDYEVDILFDNIDWDEACKKEIEFIRIYGRINNKTGILSNLTDGGDGIYGAVRSLEHREKLRTANTGKVVSKETRQKLSQANLGKKQSEETRRKRSESLKGRKLSKEHIEKVRMKNIGKKMSIESINKIIASKTGLKHSEETKKSISLSNKGKTRNSKKILCTSNGLIFNSNKEAGEYFNIGSTAISKQITGKRKNRFNLKYI
jgi:hypothetical protein